MVGRKRTDLDIGALVVGNTRVGGTCVDLPISKGFVGDGN